MQLEESEDQYVQAERRYNSVKTVLDEKEKELGTASLKLQEALSTSAAHNNTIKQLEEAVQRYAPTNTHLGLKDQGMYFICYYIYQNNSKKPIFMSVKHA